jgi:hypothetical protein
MTPETPATLSRSKTTLIFVAWMLLLGLVAVLVIRQAMARVNSELNHRSQVAPGKRTWSLLNQWAQDHDQAFPDLPGDANVNFRLLVQSGITDDEKPFGTPGDGLCLWVKRPLSACAHNSFPVRSPPKQLR